MERKIGEIFEYKGEWYQCINGFECTKCDLHQKGRCTARYNDIGSCSKSARQDNAPVIFKKLEKVGEPYMTGNKLIQRYKIYPTTCCINVYGWYYQNLDVKSWTIDIEIKQNKEDMEEKNQDIIEFQGKKYKFIPCEEREACSTLCAFKNLSQSDCWDIPCSPRERRDDFKGYFVELSPEEIAETLVDEVKRNIENQAKNNMETSKLKPFDLQKAREGKPACTRDGRKARIICFDRRDDNNYNIVALIEDKNREEVRSYYNDGKYLSGDEEAPLDLMMLPEKKEGWVNVYKNPTTRNIYTSADIFESKEIAKEQGTQRNRIATCKITWEE